MRVRYNATSCFTFASYECDPEDYYLVRETFMYQIVGSKYPLQVGTLLVNKQNCKDYRIIRVDDKSIIFILDSYFDSKEFNEKSIISALRNPRIIKKSFLLFKH